MMELINNGDIIIMPVSNGANNPMEHTQIPTLHHVSLQQSLYWFEGHVIVPIQHIIATKTIIQTLSEEFGNWISKRYNGSLYNVVKKGSNKAMIISMIWMITQIIFI